jgi:hypothetical protein
LPWAPEKTLDLPSENEPADHPREGESQQTTSFHL